MDEMSYSQLRRIFLQNPDKYRVIVLSDRQLEVVKFVSRHGITKTSDLASSFDISSQNASGQLSKLYQKGYLSRSEEPDPTGGNIYLYKANNEIIK